MKPHQEFDTQSRYIWVLFITFALALTFMLTSLIRFSADEAMAVHENNIVRKNMLYSGALLETSMGTIEIDFYSTQALRTVANFISLAEQDFYDGMRFHRVIEDFIIQTGDPFSRDDERKNEWGTGGPGYTFADEFHDVAMTRGVVAMANSGSDTNGSQFFILTAESAPWLDGKHTIFGRVVDGVEAVERIDGVETDQRDIPLTPVVLNDVVLR